MEDFPLLVVRRHGIYTSMRFVGEFEQKLDDKGRIVMPSNFRADIEGTRLIVALGDYGELGIWPEAEWEKRAEEKQAHEHDSEETAVAFREFTKNAHDVKLDGQFRFAISENLRRKGGFALDKASQPLFIIGARNRIEVWERSRHLAFYGEEG